MSQEWFPTREANGIGNGVAVVVIVVAVRRRLNVPNVAIGAGDNAGI